MTHSAEPHLKYMRTRALVLLAALVQQLRGLLPNGAPTPKALRCLILRLLCPAEALMRRVIALTAAEIERPQRRTPQKPKSPLQKTGAPPSRNQASPSSKPAPA